MYDPRRIGVAAAFVSAVTVAVRLVAAGLPMLAAEGGRRGGGKGDKKKGGGGQRGRRGGKKAKKGK